MNKTRMKTVEEIVYFLGGDRPLGELFRVHHKAVANWRYNNEFPANTYLVLKDMLKEHGRTAPDRLWSMKKVRFPNKRQEPPGEPTTHA